MYVSTGQCSIHVADLPSLPHYHIIHLLLTEFEDRTLSYRQRQILLARKLNETVLRPFSMIIRNCGQNKLLNLAVRTVKYGQ